jgi:hypothetical protein
MNDDREHVRLGLPPSEGRDSTLKPRYVRIAVTPDEEPPIQARSYRTVWAISPGLKSKSPDPETKRLPTVAIRDPARPTLSIRHPLAISVTVVTA